MKQFEARRGEARFGTLANPSVVCSFPLVVAKSSADRPLAALLLFLLVCVMAPPADAAEEKEVTAVVTKEGLHFKLPPDWPVEKRGGVMAPIPVEEYLAQKFGAIQGRLQGLEQQMVGLELKLRVVEEELKKRNEKGLQSTEGRAP